MKVCAVLLAAGRSERYGRDKLWVDIDGQPLWLRSYKTLRDCPGVASIGIVAQSGKVDEFRQLASEALFVVEGGATRQASSRIGVHAVPNDYEAVIVHDAARAFVENELVGRVIEGVQSTGAAFPGIPLVDTIKERCEDVWSTPDRSRFVSVQTPQGANLALLLRAHQEAEGDFTDEMSIIESIGEPVAAVMGDPKNIKVTHPSDISRILGGLETRTGLGYDVHAFSSDPNRPMWLGGIEFDDRPGLDGHSDADALIHAIVDALLGAACLGDIGVLYPNTDSRWKDAPSSIFLSETSTRLRDQGWTIRHIDATVIAERPKVMTRRDEICQKISELLGIPTVNVSIKATTNEGLGSIGRGEGLSAFAVCTISRNMASK